MTRDPAHVKTLPAVQAAEFIQWLHDGEPFEVCIIGPKKPTSNLWEGRSNGKGPVSGWFTDAELAAKLACQVEAKGVYVTLNPVNDALLARAESRFKVGVDRTADKSIAGIKNLLIDLDPVRESGVSSTDAEHQAALDMAQIFMADLTSEGWPDPLPGDSGNGAHLIYAIDLPNTPETVALVKAVLQALALRYADQLAARGLDLDLTVFNPARLTKFYGTWARKGDDTKTRPHRLSKVLHFPERQPVAVGLLLKLAATIPTEEKLKAPTSRGSSGQVDVGAYLAHYGRAVVKVKDHAGGHLYCLQECVFDPTHASNEAAIFQPADGPLLYKCFHGSCKARTWAEARQVISGDDKLGQFMAGGALPRERIQEQDSSFSIEGLSTKVESALKNGDLTTEEIAYVLKFFNKPAPGLFIAAEVREWALSSSGVFLSSDFVKEAGLSSMSSDRNFNKNLSKIFERLVHDEIIERVGDKRGCFRRIDRGCEEIDFLNEPDGPGLNIKWPFGLEKLVETYEKTVSIIAGSKDAGKTAFLLNFVRNNMAIFPIVYFSSEMGAKQFAVRLKKFGYPLSSWKFRPKARSTNFSDVIEPDSINIIDYLEISDKFYNIGGLIREIYDKLRTGIAIITIQKDKDARAGRGGDFSKEKAILYVTLENKNPYNKMEIIVGKNWAGERNPAGLKYHFKLVQGAKIIEMGEPR